MSLFDNADFQLGALFLILDLLRIYTKRCSRDWEILGSMLKGFGLGLVCVPIFDAPRYIIIIVLLLWILPLRFVNLLNELEDIELGENEDDDKNELCEKNNRA